MADLWGGCDGEAPTEWREDTVVAVFSTTKESRRSRSPNSRGLLDYDDLEADLGAIFSIAAGATLVGYVTVEITMLNQPSWTKTEAFYLAVGLAMALLGALELTVV